MSIKHLRSPRLWCAAALILVLGAWTGQVFADPPDRVARISYLGGNVSFQPAGSDQWVQASLNRPMVTGDSVYTDRDSRVEFELGGATVRLDAGSTFDLLNLDDAFAQIQLTGGVMNLDVRRLGEGQTYEVDTPTLAFVVRQPGNYRVDIAPSGDSTMVTVFDGSGDVYGENNASYNVRAGNTYRFNDSVLRDYEILDIPRNDPFDRWCTERSHRYQNAVSSRYVPETMIGYADLDTYGTWSSAPDYGAVWYPTRVATGWAPYRSGHWSWIDPWGWTWVDTAPWGFAPFHYGRWAYIGNRWGWCPGPRVGVAVYTPAMVAFVGGGWGSSVSIGIGGGPVGWFPLGPRDVYVPWYRTSRDYFVNVNVRNTTIINNTYITNVYNDYSRGRPLNHVNYAYRTSAAAVTAVPRDVFTGSRPVLQSRVRVDQAALRNTTVATRLDVAPVRSSIVPGTGRARATPPSAVASRSVIARTAPPPRTAPVDARLQAIQRNQSQPLQRAQLNELSTATRAAPGGAATPARQRVQVVGKEAPARPAPLPTRAATPQRGAASAPAQRGRTAPGQAAPAPTRSATPPARTAPQPATPRPATPTRGAPATGTSPARTAPASARGGNSGAAPSGALPSSRFAPPRGGAENRAAPVQRTPAAAPQRSAVQPSTRQPAPATRSPAQATPTPRSITPPAQRSVAPVPPRQSAPPQRTTSSPAPQRMAPAPQRMAPAPQRTAPAPQRMTPSPAPQRAAPRPAPQRSAPVSAPQRAAPQPQRAQPAPQRAQPTQRAHPPARGNDRDKDHRR